MSSPLQHQSSPSRAAARLCLCLAALGSALAGPARAARLLQKAGADVSTMRLAAAGGPLQSAWGQYMHHLGRAPVRTKMFTSVIAAALGDVLAQKMGRTSDKNDRGRPRRHDWVRTFRFCLFNGAFMAPLGHHYYNALDRAVMPHAPKAPAAVLSKMLFDQLVFAPICTCIFYLYKVASERRVSQYRAELSDKFVPTMVANYKLWPAAHLVNFALVPTNQRILYANVVSVLGTYLLSRAAAGDFCKPRPGEAQHPVSTEVVFDGVIEKFE